jgi:hypothetical protein
MTCCSNISAKETQIERCRTRLPHFYFPWINTSFCIKTRLHQAHGFDLKTAIALIAGISVFIAMTWAIMWLRMRNRIIRKQKKELDIALNTLTERDNLLRQLYDDSPNFILTHKTDGEILSANNIAVNEFTPDVGEVKGSP